MAKDEKKDGEKKEKEDEVICAVYKLNLHCRQCARQIQKPLKRCKGVQKIDVDIESGEITVTGKFESKEIHTLIEKISKKKVEMTSVKAIKKETEKVAVTTTVIKVQMHCEKCEYDLRRKIRKLKGVKSVTTNREAQICTIEGTVEQDILFQYVRKTTRKHVEIVVKEEAKKKEDNKEKDKGSKDKEEKSGEDMKDESKSKEIVVPYFVHCTHGHELFSDENPNACFVM